LSDAEVRVSDDESVNREIRAFSRSQAIDRTEDYLRRGRLLAQAESEVLKEQWIATYRKWCHAVRDYDLQRAANDIESELTLRGEEMPIDQVVAEMQMLAEALKQELQRLGPDQLRRMGETMLSELEDYRRRSRAQH
jgi:hypothetical protein